MSIELVLYGLMIVMWLCMIVAVPVFAVLALVRIGRRVVARFVPRRSTILSTDRARAHAVAALSDGYAEGRLDLAELDRRTTAAFGARTAGDLASLFADLPPPQRARTVPARELIAGVALLLFCGTTARIVGAMLVLGTLVPGVRRR